MKVIVATNNYGKLAELRALLGESFELLTLTDAGLSSPEETGETFEDNALIKARAASSHADAAIADDSGLEVDALGGAPGVRSSRYSGESATDADNNEKLLGELSAVPDDRRTGRFVSCVAFVTSTGQQLVAHGSIEGRVGFSPRGTGGFGYDPLFFIDDVEAPTFAGRTMAELEPEEKNRISHRARAFAALRRQLLDRGFLTDNGDPERPDDERNGRDD